MAKCSRDRLEKARSWSLIWVSIALMLGLSYQVGKGTPRTRPISNSALASYVASAQNPNYNVAPAVPWGPVCGYSGLNNSAVCTDVIVHDITVARALEGLGALQLPVNYSLLSTANQIYTLLNLERTARGLAPIYGTLVSLNSTASAGANSATDPAVSGYGRYSSIWAGNEVNALAADYDWLYNDGWNANGSTPMNLNCTSATASGCWGHRDDILANMSESGYPNMDAGVGVALGVGGFSTSFAVVMVGDSVSSPSSYAFTWSSEVANILVSSGDAPFYGSTGGVPLNRPIVAVTRTYDGLGYWLVASDGGVFSFGDATFYGSTGNLTLNKPIVGMAATADGKGYWLVASDGGVFTFGDAGFYGSAGAAQLPAPIDGMAATSDGKGYWLVSGSGYVYNF